MRSTKLTNLVLSLGIPFYVGVAMLLGCGCQWGRQPTFSFLLFFLFLFPSLFFLLILLSRYKIIFIPSITYRLQQHKHPGAHHPIKNEEYCIILKVLYGLSSIKTLIVRIMCPILMIFFVSFLHVCNPKHKIV